MKVPLLLSLLSLLMLAFMLITAHGAPLHTPLHSAGADMLAAFSREELVAAGIPEPPMGRAARNVSPAPPSISPLVLPFIKVHDLNSNFQKQFFIIFPFLLQNPHCSLHTDSNTTVPKMCGLRQLDLPEGSSGIKSWNPNICRRFHCKCLATKEVHRMKRTIADNKATTWTQIRQIQE